MDRQQMLNPKIIGAIIGLVVGLIVVTFGILKALVVALLVLAGWFVARVWMGEIDLTAIYERFRSSRGKGRRR